MYRRDKENILGNKVLIKPQGVTKQMFQCNLIACRSECGANEFTCDDSQCVSSVRRCDRRRDCADGSDELNCRKSPFYLYPQFFVSA